MDPQVYSLIEPAVIFATLIGTAFGVKLLVWGKGPIRQIRRGGRSPAADEHLVEMEERLRQLSDVVVDLTHRLDDHEERLDFAERVLTRHREDHGGRLPPAVGRDEET